MPNHENRVDLKSLDPNYTFWCVIEYKAVSSDWHDGQDVWAFYRQKIWPCTDGIFEPAQLQEIAYSKDVAAMAVREFGDLTDPYTRNVYDAIKQGVGPVTMQLVAELLPTCDDYEPSKD